MEKGAFEQQIGNTFDRLRKMEQCASAFPEKHRRLLSAAMEELSVTLEALRVAGEELGRRQERLAQLASFPELNPNPVIEVDLTGHIHYLNQAARHLFPAHPPAKTMSSLAPTLRMSDMTLPAIESWMAATISSRVAR